MISRPTVRLTEWLAGPADEIRISAGGAPRRPAPDRVGEHPVADHLGEQTERFPRRRIAQRPAQPEGPDVRPDEIVAVEHAAPPGPGFGPPHSLTCPITARDPDGISTTRKSSKVS
ncbi:hypothetical protein [Skermanella aerolata]|uniref:hypothetical protein n=1 Tax=Skermanella aerolata TaxID=393310 RepID=UPI0011BD746F|nr:hypothetical protein [Skermanella aerolata]